MHWHPDDRIPREPGRPVWPWVDEDGHVASGSPWDDPEEEEDEEEDEDEDEDEEELEVEVTLEEADETVWCPVCHDFGHYITDCPLAEV